MKRFFYNQVHAMACTFNELYEFYGLYVIARRLAIVLSVLVLLCTGIYAFNFMRTGDDEALMMLVVAAIPAFFSGRCLLMRLLTPNR